MPRQRPTYVCCRCAHTGKWHFNKVGSWAVASPSTWTGTWMTRPRESTRLGDALCRLCSEKDETSWMPAQCLGFDGNSCDGNSFELKTHPQTGRPIRYGAGKGTFLCGTCAKAYWCPHGRRRNECKECGGSGICPHGTAKHVQSAGLGASASTGGCETGARSAGARASASTGGGEARARSAGLSDLRAREAATQCKECGGSQICEHGRRRSDVQGVRGLEHLRAREAATHLHGVRGRGICEHGRRRSKECGSSLCSCRRLQGLPRRLTCCVFGTVFNTTGRCVSHPRPRVRGRVHRAASRRDGALNPKS